MTRFVDEERAVNVVYFDFSQACHRIVEWLRNTVFHNILVRTLEMDG